MANYPNPIDRPNAFFTTPLVVVVARHVRIVAGTNEVVVEAANTLPRQIRRVDQDRTFPRPQRRAPPERNLPECGHRTKAY
jgi:hypothetical protein